MAGFDRGRVARYFDGLGVGEWERLENTVQGRIKAAIHHRYLRRAMADAASEEPTRVLDVGAGPGRFALAAIGLGARVTLVDVSPAQLDEARRRIGDAGAADGVDGYVVASVDDLSPFPDASFDVTLCFGGPVSYAYDRSDVALRELRRVTRKGGMIALSVMSLYGALRLVGPVDAADALEASGPMLESIVGTDTWLTDPDDLLWHLPLRLYTSAGLHTAIYRAGLEARAIATADPLVPEFLEVPRIAGSETAEDVLTMLELALCEVPGLRDAGEHLIALARRR